MRIYKYIFLLLLLFAFISCDEEEQVYTKEAVLKWQGYYAADGCGFFLEIDNKEYKPENENIINDEFKVSDSTLVLVTFECLREKIEYWCGWSGQLQMEGIKIKSIEKLRI